MTSKSRLHLILAVVGLLACSGSTALLLSQYWFHMGWSLWLWLALFPCGLIFAAAGMNSLRQGLGTNTVALIVSFGILFLLAFPFIVVVVFGSFLSRTDLLTASPQLFPPNPTGEWYRTLWERPRFPEAVRTSLIVSCTSAIFTVILSVLGAYAIARLRFPGRTALYNAAMLSYMLPGIALLIPIVAIFRVIGFVDSVQGLFLAHSAVLLPLAVWLLVGAFEVLEPEIEHAARVDGANRLTIVRRIVIPATIPSVATVAVFAFVLSWNELLVSRALATSRTAMLSPEIVKLMDPIVRIEPMVSAAGVISSVPVLLLALALQRFMIRGLGEGAVR